MGQRRMFSIRKEESKLSYKYSTNRRNQKQARNTFHFRNINVKKKKKKQISYRFFATRQRNIEKSGCEEKEQNQSGTYGYALLPSRNTSIAPRYILPNARTNIHPALLITAHSSMPLPPRRWLSKSGVSCCKAENSYLNSRYHLT